MGAEEMPGSQRGTAAIQQIILVVDGRPRRLFYTSIFLQRSGYQVIMAQSVEDARLFLGLTVLQAVVGDLELPDQGGFELLKQMRQDHRTRNVPFIIYTANPDPEVRRACEAAGCAAYLLHPVSLDAVYQALQNATQAKPRNFVRITTALEVVVGDNRPEDSTRKDLIVALSEKGMFVSTDTLLEVGTILPFTFHLPSAPGWFFRIEGQVLYTHAGAETRKLSGMAVKFLKMSDQERVLLQDFIKQELMAGIAPTPATD